VARIGNGAWLPDSKRIVFTGYTADNTPRGYLQEIPAGLPRAITPSGVVLADRAAAPDENAVLGRAGTTWALFPIEGGDDRPVPALSPEMSRFNGATAADIYTVAGVKGPGRRRRCLSCGVGNSGRTLWKTLMPSDPIRVRHARNVVIAPDAQSCYSYMRRLGDLFVVDRLK
jgi:hypothetical protein